jgi:acetyl-CoA decarbonylase/synthase complex subunit delta
MMIEIPREKSAGAVTEVTLGATAESGGTRSCTLTIGGSTSLPFHFFEGRQPNCPVIAMEVFDRVPPRYPDSLRALYGDLLDHPAEMAAACVERHGAEMISVRLEGTHPEKGDRTPQEAVETVRAVLEGVDVPIIVTGHSHFEKINEVMKRVCEAAQGENCLINYVETDNYKTIAAACIAYGHTLVAQSPIDVNLAKQLNILLTDMDFPADRIVIDPLTSTLGYGLEYTYSIMERIRVEGLAGDKMLAFPMLVNPGYESAKVKEARSLEKDNPEWGDPGTRIAYWEIATAMASLAAGADLLVMYHPEAVRAVKAAIDEIWSTKERT